MHIFKTDDLSAESVGRKAIFKDGDYLLRAGEVSTAAFFVLSGALRLFFNTRDAEVTLEFFFENSVVTSIASFKTAQPSEFSIQCIESSCVMVMSRQDIDDFLTSHPEFGVRIVNNLENRLIYYVNRLKSFLSLTAEARYEELSRLYPQILQRVKQKYIASYVGVKPESLSRIRRLRS